MINEFLFSQLKPGQRVHFKAGPNHRQDWEGPKEFDVTVKRVFHTTNFGYIMSVEEDIEDLYEEDGWQWYRIQPDHEAELWKITLEYYKATSALHEVHGSTAVHGGVGGQALTPHCAYVCQHPGHKKVRDRYEEAYSALVNYSKDRGTDE